MRRNLWILTLLAACNTTTDDLDIDTDPIVVPDETGETGETDTDDSVVLSPDDTGALFQLEISGEASVARGVKFEGWQAVTARWLKGGVTPGKPKCIYLQDIVNWERQVPAPSAENPISPARFEACPDCDFAFTLVGSNTREADRYPTLFDTDDTDTTPDLAGSSESKARHLNCDSLENNQGLVVPVDGDFRGMGFSSIADGDNDDTTGWISFWIAQGSAWSTYQYVAHFDAEAGEFSWGVTLPPYEYALP